LRRPKRGEERRGHGHGYPFCEKLEEKGVYGWTYGQIAVLLPVFADFPFCDGHRLGRVGLLLHLLWRVGRAVCLRSDSSGGKGVGHGRGRSAGSAGLPVADNDEERE
jgi:hypothetical protein